MTREEAIQMLRLYEVNEYGEGELETWYNGIDKDMREALDMAIEALKADAVDCTDFIEWLVDRVLDETIWEYNSVAYGEIICRKLEKLGVLEVTEEPSYYIRPSADAVQGWIPCGERVPKENEYVDNVCKYYLIQDEYGDMHVAHLSGRGWETIESIKALGCDVIAWMPLPKPYKGGDDE